MNIAKLPSVPRQILKDIPRPPNSASRDVLTFGAKLGFALHFEIFGTRVPDAHCESEQK